MMTNAAEIMPLPNGNNGLADTRDNKGRFLTGNPRRAGKPTGPQRRRLALADFVSADDAPQVMQKLMDAAKAVASRRIRELLIWDSVYQADSLPVTSIRQQWLPTLLADAGGRNPIAPPDLSQG